MKPLKYKLQSDIYDNTLDEIPFKLFSSVRSSELSFEIKKELFKIMRTYLSSLEWSKFWELNSIIRSFSKWILNNEKSDLYYKKEIIEYDLEEISITEDDWTLIAKNLWIKKIDRTHEDDIFEYMNKINQERYNDNFFNKLDEIWLVKYNIEKCIKLILERTLRRYWYD